PSAGGAPGHYAGRVRPRRFLSLLALLGAAMASVVLIGEGPAQAAERATGNAPTGHVVVIGLDGLQWSDVTQAGMPALFNLVARQHRLARDPRRDQRHLS